MALQTSIDQYFGSRKRRAVDEINKVSYSNKVLILDKNEGDLTDPKEASRPDGETELFNSKKVVYHDSPKIVKAKKIVSSAPKLQGKTPKTTSTKKLQQKLSGKQGDIRKSLIASFNASLIQASHVTEETKESKNADKDTIPEKVNVPFEIKGALSPKKIRKVDHPPNQNSELYRTPKKGESTIQRSPLKILPGPSDEPEPASKIPTGDSIDQIKSKLLRSSRLTEIRNALKKINDGHEKLKEIEAKKVPPKSPSLKKFSTLEIEFTSPTKSRPPTDILPVRPSESPSLLRRSLLMSPPRGAGLAAGSSSKTGYISPRKLFTETSPSKPAAFERHSALAAQGRPSLTLPFKYRTLAEAFRSIDTVMSMLHNRNETIHFSKLKSSVQQMTKKNMTETQLAQLHALCPEFFSFKQEKTRHVPGRPEQYELVITPHFDAKDSKSNEDANKNSAGTTLMTPTVLHERGRKLYLALLEKTKQYHEEFLQTLDPPITLDKSKLTRWHPEFDVDGVPDILPAPLPLPPNVETFSSAKDVLAKARDMFICNPRMEKALEKISTEKVEAKTSTSASKTALKNALKGIPLSILERVRAKQAAKAAENLTRDPQIVKKKIEFSRLPELARIVRNLFVGEKKSILPKTLTLAKISNSFREVLSPKDMEEHLSLLIATSPGWMSLLQVGKEWFYKINKTTDLSKVLLDIQNATNKL